MLLQLGLSLEMLEIRLRHGRLSRCLCYYNKYVFFLLLVLLALHHQSELIVSFKSVLLIHTHPPLAFFASINAFFLIQNRLTLTKCTNVTAVHFILRFAYLPKKIKTTMLFLLQYTAAPRCIRATAMCARSSLYICFPWGLQRRRQRE